jgi:hypothetical protein
MLERVFLPDMLVFPAMLERGGRNAGAPRMRLLAVIALAMLRPAATATASSRAICRRASLIFALLCSCTAAQSEALLPSQDDPNVFSVKICQDRTVVAAIKSTADKILKTDVLIAKGMQADDIHMDGVYVDERLVYCSMTMTAKRVTDNVRYIIGPKGNSYVIILGGNVGSKLFPKDVVIGPVQDETQPSH